MYLLTQQCTVLTLVGQLAYTARDMSVTIIVIESDGAVARQNLKEAMPKSVRESLDAVGKAVEMESGEQMRDKLPGGFPREFVIKEEILVFPDDEDDDDTKRAKKTKKRLNNMRNNIVRKTIPGNV